MKVLQINAVNGIKSTGRTTLEMAEYLEDNGHEPYIAYSEGHSFKNGFKVGTKLEKKRHAFSSRLFGKQAYFSKSGTKDLLNYIEEIKPDIVTLGNLHANYINLNMLLDFLAKKDIATVITLHDCWFYTAKCTHYTIDSCYKWKTGCYSCPRLKKDNPSWFLDKTPQMYADKKERFQKIHRLAVIGVSDWITKEAKQSYLNKAMYIDRIYNGIDQEIFKPIINSDLKRNLGIEEKFIILGVASAWTKNKGLDMFIDLAKRVNDDINIILIGNINENIKLPTNIIHIKETHNSNELAEYYGMADVFLNLSSEESFGKVTAESLSCGTPAIVLNATANPELIGPGCGYIVKQNDIDSLISCISNVRINKKEYYSKSCIKYATLNFNKEVQYKKYLDLFERLILIKGDS